MARRIIKKNVMQEVRRAAMVINTSKALIVTAGAGMGVDSGLPDFRGPQGFWRAYPPLKEKGIQLPSMSNPRWFFEDPAFAWGFFGHRYELYKSTEPHKGFTMLREWGEKMDYGYFVYTSNVDGHFQKAGFSHDHIVECHGRINYLQCADISKNSEIWPMDDVTFDIDMSTLKCRSALPQGPPGVYDKLACPNILMFSDFDFLSDITDAQEERYHSFIENLNKKQVPFVVIEIGAGHAVPTIRITSEQLVDSSKQATLIRINPTDSDVPDSDKFISLPVAGLEGLTAISEALSELQRAGTSSKE